MKIDKDVVLAIVTHVMQYASESVNIDKRFVKVTRLARMLSQNKHNISSCWFRPGGWDNFLRRFVSLGKNQSFSQNILIEFNVLGRCLVSQISGCGCFVILRIHSLVSSTTSGPLEGEGAIARSFVHAKPQAESNRRTSKHFRNFGDCDAFVPHTWHDDDAKWDVLKLWSKELRAEQLRWHLPCGCRTHLKWISGVAKW